MPFLQDALHTLVVTAPPQAALPRAPSSAGAGRTRRQAAPAYHIVNEALFRDALAREQKRADRFEQPVGLVLVSPVNGTPPEPQFQQLVNALAASRRAADVIGWFDDGGTLGIIRSHVDLDPLETADSLEATVRGEIEKRVTPGQLPAFRLQSGLYSPHTGHSHGDSQAAPLFGLTGREGACVYRASKRALDIAGSAALLVACAPLLLVISALVKWTSKGPVFFRQERLGERARPFMMLKFRTMRVDVGAELHQQYVTQFIQGQVKGGGPSERASATAPPVFKIVGDPRVTPVGAFLRRTSLDEVPQFWNVLKGEMSLVGPRPPLAYEVKLYKPWHRLRVLEAKPGITGLWQVTGRSRTTFDEMVRLDIHYARTRSLWLDLKILLATPRAVLSGNGAH